MRENLALLFLMGALLCTLAFFIAFFQMRKLRNIVFAGGILTMLLASILRIYLNWPLVYLFQEAYLISLFCGVISLYLIVFQGMERMSIWFMGLTAIIATYTCLFPADIYVSFVKTNSIFAHSFSIFSSAARSAYLVSFIVALYGLVRRDSAHGDELLRLNTNLIIAGFALQSVGMFSGGVWSFAGWGNPVQWQSPIFLGMAGVWFYYSWFLHLKIGNKSAKKSLLGASVLGGVLTMVFTFFPETGNFSIPGGF